MLRIPFSRYTNWKSIRPIGYIHVSYIIFLPYTSVSLYYDCSYCRPYSYMEAENYKNFNWKAIFDLHVHSPTVARCAWVWIYTCSWRHIRFAAKFFKRVCAFVWFHLSRPLAKKSIKYDQWLTEQKCATEYDTPFLANFNPLPWHTLSHIPGPQKYVTHLWPPPPRILVCLVQTTRTKASCTNSLSIVRGSFRLEVLSGGLLSGWFLSVPPSVRIHLLQRKVKYHFKFHVSYVW